MVITDGSQLFMYQNLNMVVYSRYFCAIVLHLALMDEFKQGLNMMKYALNHPYKFGENWWIPFVAGTLKQGATLTVEFICVMVCCISIAPMAIVYNFIALGIIADFDNYVFESYIDSLKVLATEE